MGRKDTISRQIQILLLFLAALLTPMANAESPKLGSDDDLIRQMLFACQPMKDLLKQVKLEGNRGPFQRIANASKMAEEGKKQEAVSELRGTLALPELETRVQLWVWSGLRELGEKPSTKEGGEVLGVILEVPMEGAFDTLAAYADGTARYLNYSGAAVFWDTQDSLIKQLCQQFITSVVPTSSKAEPRSGVSLPKPPRMQVTMLTRSGNFVIVEPPVSIVRSGAALMTELIKRSQKKSGN